MTEEILTQLGRLHPRLGVIARTSVMKYKGTRKSIRQIGRELGVAYALEGSVRRHGGPRSCQRPVDRDTETRACLGRKLRSCSRRHFETARAACPRNCRPDQLAAKSGPAHCRYLHPRNWNQSLRSLSEGPFFLEQKGRASAAPECRLFSGSDYARSLVRRCSCRLG